MMPETPWLPVLDLRLANPETVAAKQMPYRACGGLCSTNRLSYAAAGTGSAVTDLIFSIAKRDVTFFSGTAPISFL
jgi:hypothetical protein